MDPADPDTLYAAAWQLRRDAFSGGSPATQDGTERRAVQDDRRRQDVGEDDRRAAREGRLRPVRPERLPKDPNVVYAVVQTSETVGALGNAGQPATPVPKDGQERTMGRVETGGIFRSDDKGQTWKKINDLVPRPFYYGQIRVDPTDDQHLYVLGVTFHASTDGGTTFAVIGRTIHADHHALWINPKDPNHLIVGNDGGLYVSKDRGKTFEAKRGLVIGQFYGVAVDMQTPYRVYGGLQDNGSWGGPSATAYPDGITLADWRRLVGGDGFQAAADPTDPNTVYVESRSTGRSTA